MTSHAGISGGRGAKRQRLHAKLLLGLVVVLAASILVFAQGRQPAFSARHRDTAGPRPVERSTSARARAGFPATQRTVARFLQGYLLYLYGRAPARAVKDTTSVFARSLEQHRLHVPEGLRNLHPRVRRILPEPAPHGLIGAQAIVSDEEVVTYRISLVLTISGGRELVDGWGEP